MSKKRKQPKIDSNLINALNKIDFPIYDKKHDLYIYAIDNRARSNESRFEHIAKSHHELKVRDIEGIPDGIENYFKFTKSTTLKETFYYFYKRKGESKGFVQLAIKLFKNNKKKAYIKTIYIAYRIK